MGGTDSGSAARYAVSPTIQSYRLVPELLLPPTPTLDASTVGMTVVRSPAWAGGVCRIYQVHFSGDAVCYELRLATAEQGRPPHMRIL